MISKTVIKGQPDGDQASCYDCRHCKAALSWWCVNEDAISWRGTRLAGVIKCPFWDGVDQARWWHHLTPFVLILKPDNTAKGDS